MHVINFDEPVSKFKFKLLLLKPFLPNDHIAHLIFFYHTLMLYFVGLPALSLSLPPSERAAAQ